MTLSIVQTCPDQGQRKAYLQRCLKSAGCTWVGGRDVSTSDPTKAAPQTLGRKSHDMSVLQWRTRKMQLREFVMKRDSSCHQATYKARTKYTHPRRDTGSSLPRSLEQIAPSNLLAAVAELAAQGFSNVLSLLFMHPLRPYRTSSTQP